MNTLIKNFGVLLSSAFIFYTVSAQQSTSSNGWHLKDLEKDGSYGISLQKAYDFLKSKGLKSKTVIVGIVDSGIDTTHEDLKPVLWVNAKEIPGNGVDDDKNGYIDDIHGWNFLGSNDGTKNVTKDSYEAARVYWSQKDKYEDEAENQIAASDLAEYKTWLRAKKSISKDANKDQADYIKLMADLFKEGDSVIRSDLKKETYSCKELAGYTPMASAAEKVKQILMNACRGNNNDDITNKMLMEQIQSDLDKITVSQKSPPNYRGDVVNDNYNDFNDKYYGNSNVLVNNESAVHGTHVAGIVGAVRNNGIGMDGVADNVKIMSIRAVPDGDEHDKDIALSIRYAVDNGARVINMSFGKSFSPEKKWVDEAVKYAESKNVLMIHAAGNAAANIDTAINFPSTLHLDGTRPNNWITVGASGDAKLGGLTANFSNYGKKEVDVFSPGVRIYSTMPGGNNYANLQGTSMAAPVVTGLAALVMSYYPNLTAVQVKEIIEKSVSKPTSKVKNPGTGEEVLMSELSIYGGIVNAYNAVIMADAISKTTKTITKKVSKVPIKKSSKKRKK